jgi:uncharacterized membrane protein YcaP (DUF421 family)
MDKLFSINIPALFIPAHSIAEMLVRGTIMYLALVVIMRLLMRRGVGALSIADLLVIVVIADAAQNAFSKQYQSVTEGIVLVLTIIGWDYVLDKLSYKFAAVRRFLHSAPLLLVRQGKVIKSNMKQESLTEQELMSHLRLQGIENLSEVKKAFLEDDGQISVIRETGAKREGPRKTESKSPVK